MITPHFTLAQVYVPRLGQFPEAASTCLYARTGDWQTVEFHLPAAITRDGRLRLDPADARGIVEIAEMEIVDQDTGEIVWSTTAAVSAGFSVGGTAIAVDDQSPLQLVSFGNDPIVLLPPMDGVAAGSLFRVRMCARIGESAFWTFVISAVNACLEDESNETRDLLALTLVCPEKAIGLFRSLYADRNELRAKRQDISALTEQLRHRDEELVASQANCGKYLDIMRAVKQELTLAQTALKQQKDRNGDLDQELQKGEGEHARLQEYCDRIQEDCARTAGDLARKAGELEHARAEIEALRTSWSWKLTAPLRYVASAFVGK